MRKSLLNDKQAFRLSDQVKRACQASCHATDLHVEEVVVNVFDVFGGQLRGVHVQFIDVENVGDDLVHALVQRDIDVDDLLADRLMDDELELLLVD